MSTPTRFITKRVQPGIYSVRDTLTRRDYTVWEVWQDVPAPFWVWAPMAGRYHDTYQTKRDAIAALVAGVVEQGIG
jgi:hypothetical protein